MKYNILKSKSWVYCFFLSFLIIFSSVSASAAVTYCSPSAFGYGHEATGGGSATPVLVSSVSQLQSALNKGKNKVIIITQNLTFTSMLTVQSGENVTLMGLPGVKLISNEQTASTSGILFVKKFSNIVIRNLTFVGPGAYDCDGNDLLCFENVTNAWVDHCDFQDGCDGNFDNKHNTDNVTVSWCRFRYLKAPRSGGSGGSDDHRFTNLLGASSSDAPSDGTYNFTWAYCWWDEGCKERMLRCRNASLHFLNCYWNSSVANYYIGPENADCYIEGCTFEGNPVTKKIFYQNYNGKNGAKFINCTATKGLPANVTNRTVVTPSYSYAALSAAEAKTAVTNATCGAGATLTVTTSGAVSSSCDGGAPLPTVYTVTWNANGGSCGTASTQVTSGNAIGTLPEATKIGYNFDGWYTAPSGGDKISATTPVTANVTYYAQFTTTTPTVYYTVIWDANGGSCGTTSSNVESGLTIGSVINPLPTATKSGDYSFDGWYTAVNGGTKITASTPVTGNVTYYAHYTATGGGGGGEKCMTFGTTSGDYSTDGTFTNGNYTIVTNEINWEAAHAKFGNNVDYISFANANGISAAKIYAKTANVQVTYSTSTDGSTGTSTETITVSESSYTLKNLTVPANTKYIKLQRVAGTSTYVNQVCLTEAGSSSTPTYTLSYDENGGSGTMAGTEQTGASVTVAACTFTPPTGYSFQKWNTAGNGGGTDYAASASITLTEDMTLYAIWNPQSYTVTLDADGGIGGSASVSATFDAAMPAITVPSKAGNIFQGYFTGANGTGTQYYDENGSSTNNWTTAAATTLYAYWVPGSTPDPTGCDLHFWFIKADDATANSKTNDGTVFSGMVGNKSSLEGSLTIDGKSYSVTGRSDDAANLGSFTIPSGKTGIFYALAVSSGSGDRQINLVCGPNTYELPVAGGSTSYKRIESEELPEGTYSIQRDGSSNVRLGVVAVKICDAAVGTKTVYLDPNISEWEQGNERYAVYYFESANPSNEGWVDMSATGSSECFEMYQAEIPAGYDKCIFCRMNGSDAGNNWTNRWDQTVDQIVADGMYCTITASSGGSATCTFNNTPFQVCVTGTWLRFAGETITLNATCEGATHFQWYKGGTDESNKIEGATSATFTKTGCTLEDGDYYYCKAWAVGGSEVTSGPWGVKVPYLEYQTPGVGTDNKKVMLTRVSESAEVATCTVYPGVAWGYEFTISDFAERYGNSGTMDRTHTGWNMDKINSNWCKWNTDKEGTYTFTVTFSNTAFTYYNVTITYPHFKQTKDIPIYMEKTDDMVANGWSSLYYRIGKGKYSDGDEKNWTSAQMMTLVPGTKRYYQTKTPDWDEDFWAWHIGNNKGDENGKYSIYKTYSTGYEITKSTVFSGDEVTGDGMTIYLGTSHKGEDSGVNDNCDFYTYTHTAGMLTHDVSVGATSHGELRINWTDVNDVAQESLGAGARAINDLAHTCILTITAEPECGYRITSLTVNGVDFTSGSTHILDADATIEATFEIASYTVTLHTNGGTINSGDVTGYTFGTGATLPTDISYTGKDFTGWYDNSGCTGSPVTTITTTDCGDKEYWANWVAGKPEPVFTWDYESTVNAGGIYPISVSSTGDANVTIEIVETITGVSGSFTAGNPATGTVTLGNYPAEETFTYRASSPETSAYKAKSETRTVTIVRCAKTYDITYAGTYFDTGGTPKPRYYHETSGSGRVMKGKGGSGYSPSTEGGTFSSVGWTQSVKNQDHEIQTYKDNVVKLVFYVKVTDTGGFVSVLKRSNSHISSDSEGDDILSSSTIIYNDNPSQTSPTEDAFETITIIPATPLDENDYLYIKFKKSSTYVWGVRLYSAGGDEVTSVAFSGETEVEKYPGEAPFIKAATQTTTPIPSGGSITYKSSDESVATVDPATGEVTVLAPGRTTITATLGAFGCFDEATATYSLVVKNCGDPKCTIAVTSGSARKCASESVTLTATAAAGAVIHWYKDGAAIPGEIGSTLTTTTAGKYHATATKVCLQVSDTIEVVDLAAPTAEALHEYYYIKAGRPRPDIPLFRLTNVKIDPSSFTMNHPAPAGCSYELREDGIVYLVGTPSTTLTASTYDLTVTTANDCGFANASATLELRTLEPTAKKQIAWIAIGTHLDGSDIKPTKGETLPGTPDADKSTSHALYTYLSGFFDMTAVNAYCTTDTKKISDYCSQFDLVLLTDYPDTNVKPGDSGGKDKSYSNAFGCLMDELPLLSFEAFVADCPNWGINSNPKTPEPKDKGMLLLCAAHSIFAGTHIDVNDSITMLSKISGAGLQGFTGLDAPPGMLNIATIYNKESNGGTLVVCCERQKIIEARMMIMGLNYNDMGNLTEDGKLVIKQIIEYLLQFEEMADCALVFDNGAGNTGFNPSTYTGTGTKGDGLWSTAANWHPAYNAVPKPLQAVRVDKPCQVDVTNAHCSSIRLRKDDPHGWNGNLTIHSDAGLTVTDGIKEVRGTNYMTTYPSAASDLVIQASTSSQNGSLAFGNAEDALQATVEYYSLGTDATGAKPVWQYMGIPITNGPMAIDQYHAAWMCSWESEGNVSSNWVWVENEDRIVPFKGYCITQQASKKYIHVGALCSPNKKEFPLYYFTSVDGNGFNMFANSWVAPIDIAKMRAEDFDGAEPTIYVYNTGSREQYEGGGAPSTDGTNTGAGQFNAVPVNAAPYLSGALTKIPTMQGFFVQATREGTLTLDYDRICFNSTDYTTTAETMRAPRRATKEAAEEQIVPEVMRVDVSSARFGDRVYILSHPEFSEAFDLGWDGTKQEGDENVPMLAYVQGNKLLAVAAIETPEGQYLSFRAGEDSIYTFTFDYEGETIYLYDRLADEAAEIRTGNTYTFRATNKTAAERFLITATPPRTPTQVETVGAEPRSEKAEKIIHENKLMILYHGAVYDAQGARVTIGKEVAR